MIENISEVADPAIVSGSVEAEGQTSARLEWQRDNIHVWAETENPVTPDPGRTEDRPEPKDAHMRIRKETVSQPADGNVYVKGETIRYKLTAVNDGNVTLHDIVVSDKLTGDAGENAWRIGTLAPGERAEKYVSYTVTEADSFRGKVDNEATGTAKDPEDKDAPVTPGSTTDPVETPRPSLHVEKTSSAPSAGDGKAALGESITYTIRVTNNGNVGLDDVVITDDLTGETWTELRMESGEVKTYTTTYTITEEDIRRGFVMNVAVAEAPDPEDPEKDPVHGEDQQQVPTEDMFKHLTVTKRTTSVPEDGEAYVPGETITYSIVVVNDGNITLDHVVVTDELTGDTWEVEKPMLPGEYAEFTASYVVTEEDGIAGKVVNEAAASAEDPDDPTAPPVIPDRPGTTEDDTQPKDVPYIVEFYYQNETDGTYSEEPQTVSQRIGTVRTTVSVTEEDKTPNLQNYVLDENAGNVLSGMVVKDGSLVLKIYFKRQYQVVYEPGAHGTFESQITGNLDYGDMTPAFLNNTSGEAGYTFTGWEPKVEGIVTKDMVYVAQWQANDDTQYTVEHYFQQKDGSYELAEDYTQHLTGVTGELAVYTPKNIQGYKYQEDRTVFISRTKSRSEDVKEDAAILGDGSLVIMLYYDIYEVSTSLTATKVIEGLKPDTDSTFTFTLKAIGENAAESPILQGENHDGRTAYTTGAGVADFGNWTYYKEGVYTYNASEIAGTDKNYSYDKTVYTVTDTVKDQDGTLILERSILASGSDENVKEIVFTNIFLKTHYYEGESEPSSETEAQTESEKPSGDRNDPGTPYSGGGSYGGSSGSSTGNPKTGDNTPVEFWLIMLLASMTVIGAGGRKSYRRKRK